MKKLIAVLLVCLGMVSVTAQAAYNETITTIFPNFDVADTGWTDSNGSTLSVGLRARYLNTDIPYPERTPNSKGVYMFEGGVPIFIPTVPTAEWAFDIHMDAGNLPLSKYDFYLQVDINPGFGVNYVTLQPIVDFENAYGTRLTANGGGVVGIEYPNSFYYSVAQRSLNIAQPPFNVAPYDDGIYTINLFAVPKNLGVRGRKMASVSITVIVGNP